MKKQTGAKATISIQTDLLAALSKKIKSMDQRLTLLEAELASVQNERLNSLVRSPDKKSETLESSQEFRILRVRGRGAIGGLDLRSLGSDHATTKTSISGQFDQAYSQNGVVALCAFIDSNRADIVKYRDEFGQSLLFRAPGLKKSSEATEVCRLLLEAGLPASGPPAKYGRTPLIEMVRTRPPFHNKVANLLKSSVNIQDDEGRTALTFAVEGAGWFGSRKGSIPIIMKLIELGADPFLQTKQGKTALDFAIKSNDTEQNSDVVSLMKDLTKSGKPRVQRSRL